MTTAPRSSAGRTTSRSSCARAATKSRASAQGSSGASSGCWSTNVRVSSPRTVSPGSRTVTTSWPSARRAMASAETWVLLPAPSTPSKETKNPGHREGRDPSSLILETEDPQPAIGLRTGAPRGEVVLFDELVLETAHVRVLRRQLDGLPGLLAASGRLQRLLEGEVGLVAGVDVVHTGERAADLGDGVAAQHLDGDAHRLGGAHRRVLAAVVALQSQHGVRVVDVVLDAHRHTQLPDRLLEVCSRHSVRKHGERLVGPLPAGHLAQLALPALVG